MDKHTPEPWGVWPNPNGGELGTITDNKLARHIAHTAGGTHTAEANSARIVACVNACAGINPEAVPELLEALRAVVEDHEERVVTTELPQEQPHRILVMNNARAAIANAEDNG